jgi:hypothetical protein
MDGTMIASGNVSTKDRMVSSEGVSAPVSAECGRLPSLLMILMDYGYIVTNQILLITSRDAPSKHRSAAWQWHNAIRCRRSINGTL